MVGKRIAIEPVLRSNADIPVKTVYTTTPPLSVTTKKLDMETVQNTTQSKEHPILTLLKRELGIERIE
jgi:hypothetical protein